MNSQKIFEDFFDKQRQPIRAVFFCLIFQAYEILSFRK